MIKALKDFTTEEAANCIIGGLSRLDTDKHYIRGEDQQAIRAHIDLLLAKKQDKLSKRLLFLTWALVGLTFGLVYLGIVTYLKLK